MSSRLVDSGKIFTEFYNIIARFCKILARFQKIIIRSCKIFGKILQKFWEHFTRSSKIFLANLRSRRYSRAQGEKLEIPPAQKLSILSSPAAG